MSLLFLVPFISIRIAAHSSAVGGVSRWQVWLFPPWQLQPLMFFPSVPQQMQRFRPPRNLGTAPTVVVREVPAGGGGGDEKPEEAPEPPHELI